MPLVDFAELPDDARLWVFPASKPLSAAESERLLSTVDELLETWEAHGSSLQTSREWRLGQFLLVAVDEAATGVSGCSVDALVRCLRRVEHDLDLSLTDHRPVFFRDRESVRSVSRDEFAELARSAAVGPTTTVFDNTVPNVGALRAGLWETPAAGSWHGKAFFAS